LRALAWSSVDLGKHPTVTVSERADRYSSIGSPKSASGRRTIPLGEVTAQALKEWRLAQPPGRTLVFGNSRDNPEHLANIHARVLVPLQKRAGIRRYSLHSLRHYAISRWLAAGLDLKLCQTLAGHGSLSLTLDRYGHWISRHDDHARVAAVETAGFTN
jgi:integrase